MYDVSKFLPALLGPHSVTQDGGDAVTARPTWDFVAPLTVTDDSANDLTTFAIGPFGSSSLKVYNPAGTFYYTVTGAAIAANRVLNLPLLAATDTVVCEAFAQTLTNKTLTSPIINGQTQGAAVAVAALAIDWAASPVHTKTLAAGGNTFTFSNAASGMVISIRLTADAGGSTVTWPTMKWAGDAAPTFTASKATVVTLMHDGTTIIGVAAAEYTP